MRVFVPVRRARLGSSWWRLVGAGHEVHGMTRSRSKRAMFHEFGAVPVVADALDPDQVANAVGQARPDAIRHLEDANAKAKRELAWRPSHPSWRQGFAAA
jgi:D-arabinose 1-dehydrogenase-like Zn-dependent alcohol dehydrogenase